MRLIEANIVSFGKLKDFKYTFSSGLNVINEENGYGKSTLLAFIKSMLFGLEDTRKRELDDNDRKRYLPWDGSQCKGSLTLEYKGRKYLIERTFHKKAGQDSCTVIDLDTGLACADLTDKPGEVMLGIDVDGFERTLLLSERRLSVKNDNKTISARLSDLVGYDCDVGGLDEALDKLDERRKFYRKRGGAGRIADLEAALAQTDIQINELERLRASLPERMARQRAAAEELSTLEKKQAEASSRRIAASYENQYLAKRASKEDAEARLAKINEFFAYGVPEYSDLRSAELRCEEIKRMEAELAVAEPTKQKKEAHDGVVGRCDELIGELRARAAKKPKKSHAPLFFAISVVLAALGAAVIPVIGGVVGLAIGIPALLICALMLSLGVADAKKAKKRDTGADEIIKAANELLTSEGIGEQDEATLITALLTVRGKHEGAIAALESSSHRIAELEERLCTAKAESERFLAIYPTVDKDPFAEIRGKLTDRERLTERIAELSGELAYLVREFGINVERVGLSSDEEKDELGREELDGLIRSKRAEIALFERDLRHDEQACLALDELYARKESQAEAHRLAEESYRIIDLTAEHLRLSKELLTAKYLGKTRSAFGEYIRTLSSLDPEAFVMDTGFGIMHTAEGELRPTEAFSLGTRDYFSLAARLALVDSLYEGEEPFMLLDDPFVHFDDKKCAAALKLLRKLGSKRQIIYITCSRARAN